MKAKKVMALALAAVMLICASVAATVAYLKDDDSVVNTFTVGQVGLFLDEADVNEYGEKLYKTVNSNLVADEDELEDGDSIKEENNKPVLADRVKANEYKLIPGVTYVKDPTVTVDADSEESYIRMIVTITDLEDVKAVFGTDATGYFLPQNFVSGWNPAVWLTTNVVKEDAVANTATYEFRYYTTVSTVDDESETLAPLFTEFKVPETVTKEDLAKLNDANGKMEIHIVAHAIQAAGFDTADLAWEKF